MKISFYILSENKAQDFLGFVCQLTQTALNKGAASLLILVEDEALLSALDEALWTQVATSFIPHHSLSDTIDDKASQAPVLLSHYLPAGFKGMVLNTTIHPMSTLMAAAHHAKPTRVLELIKPDAASVQEGRHKYQAYQQLGYELSHFNV